MSNTMIVKIILSREIGLKNFFFAHWRDQYTQLEVSITANNKTTTQVISNIPKSFSDTISSWMTANHSKLPFHTELTETDSQKKFLAVISGGY